MKRRSLATAAGGVLLAAAASAARADEQPATAPPHRIVIHVGGADPALMATALHNLANAADHYDERGEPVLLEIVANGAGYTMMRADTSPVKALFAETHQRYPAAVFSACQMSRRGYAAAEGKKLEDIPQLPGVTDTPAGIARLNELQEAGWSYVRV